MLISDYFSWLILGKILVCFLWGCPGAYVYHSGLAYINTPSLVLYGSKNRLITCERFALLDSRIPMWGVQLTALRPFYRMTRLGNNVRRQCQMNTLKRQRVEFFVVLGHFCPLTLLTTQKIKILKKKKTLGDIIILHLCITNDDHMMYGSWDIKHDRRIFCHFGLCFALLPPLQPRKSKFWKKWKNSWSTKNENHIALLHPFPPP